MLEKNTYDYIINLLQKYVNKNLSVIPIRYNEKVPLIEWGGFQNKRASLQELEWYLKKYEKLNFGIVTGKISDLVVIDADTTEAVQFLEEITEFKATAKVATRRGVHYYFRVNDLPLSSRCGVLLKSHGIAIDIKSNGGYVVAPPSVFSGHNYVWINDVGIEHAWICFDYSELEAILNNVKERFNETFLKKGNKTKNIKEKDNNTTLNENSKEVLEKIKEKIIKGYKEGSRQYICLYLCGWLRKVGFSRDVVEELIRQICEETGDKDIRQRLTAVEGTYEEENLDNLKGLMGLEELGYDVNELSELVGEECYESLGKGFYRLDNLVYYKDGNGSYKTVGPYIKIITAINNEKLDEIYLYEYFKRNKSHRAIWENANDVGLIAKKTGIPIVHERKYKEWLTSVVSKLLEFRATRFTTGWNEDFTEFSHPYFMPSDDWSKWPLCENVFKKPFQNNPAKQHELIRNALLDGKILGICYCFALASVLNKIVKKPPSVMFLTGPSGVGKTSIGKLMTNLFFDSESVYTTAYFTAVGFEVYTRSLSDLVILIDECSLKELALERIIFMVASGKGKMRSNKSLTLSMKDITSNVVFTSEVDERVNFKSTGSHRRMLTIIITDFKKECFSYASPEELMRFYGGYYGGGLDIIKFIKDHKSEIEKKSDENKCIVVNNGFVDIEHMVLPVLTACDTYSLFYNENFILLKNRTIDFFLEKTEEFRYERDLLRKFCDTFSEFIVSIKNHLVDDDDKMSRPMGEICGLIRTNSQTKDREVFILTRVFNEFCFERGFEKNVLLKILKQNKILLPYDEKNYRKMKRINGVLVPTYHITFSDWDKKINGEVVGFSFNDEDEPPF